MKLFSGSGSRVNNTKGTRGSSSRKSSTPYQDYSSDYNGAVWEDDEPRVVKSDGFAETKAYRSTSYDGQESPYDGLDYDENAGQSARNYSYYAVEGSDKKQKKRRKRKRRLITCSVILVAMVGIYCLCVFSNIPFIEKWRTIYIETALMTRTHQWLATAFIPKSVVDEVRAKIDATDRLQEDLESDWSGSEPISTTVLPAITKPENSDGNGDDSETTDEIPFWEDPWSDFCLTYTELDMDSFAAYAEEHEDEMYDEDGNLFIDEAGLDDEGTTIQTVHGDQVLALDTVHGITIARLSGGSGLEYCGVIAIVKDPSRVGVAVAERLGVVGQKIAGIAEDNDAILAINASGFEDDGGVGNGGIVYGLLVSGGEKLADSDGGTYKAVYLDYDNRLHVGSWSPTNNIRDGVEFKPALVVNGEQVISGSAGWGTQPRTAIGQTEDGSIIMIVIDGRQPGYSVGITVGELAEIFIKYGAVQALNLDGGSSSIMYFNGRKITQPSGGDKENGRYLPDAFVVYANRKATDGLTRPEE